MKRLLGGIIIRFFASAIVCTMITTITVGLVLLDRGMTVTARGMAAFAAPRRPYLTQQCLADPTTWSISERGYQIYAYDAATGTSSNPNAWPLDQDLWEQVRQGENCVSRFFWLNPKHGGGILLVMNDGGPCSMVQMVWDLNPRWRMGIVSALFFSGFAMLTLSVLLTALVSLRPLLRRLAHAAETASRVGDPGTYKSTIDVREDAITRIFAALDSAHARIVRDEKELQRKQGAVLDYLANVAHDLRTPIGSLQLALEELGALRKLGSPDEHAILQTALAEITYLGALTINLHLACQLREGLDPLAGGMAELGGLVDRVVARNALVGRPRDIEVFGNRPDSPVWVNCNSIMAEQVISNLVRNSVVHGEIGGNVAVLLSSREPGFFELTVLDNGPGVPPEEIPRLEERHYRGSLTRKGDVEGSGLGLAIVGEICHRVGWQLSFHQHEPRGLRVLIRGAIAPQSDSKDQVD